MAKIEGKITITDKEGNSIVLTIEEAKKLAIDLQSTLVEEKTTYIPTGYRDITPFDPGIPRVQPYPSDTPNSIPMITYCVGD